MKTTRTACLGLLLSGLLPACNAYDVGIEREAVDAAEDARAVDVSEDPRGADGSAGTGGTGGTGNAGASGRAGASGATGARGGAGGGAGAGGWPGGAAGATLDATADASADVAYDVTGDSPETTQPDAQIDAVTDVSPPDSVAEVGTPDVMVPPDAACRQLPVVLGAASGFAVLAGSTVVSTGATVVTGDLGVSPGTAVVGFPPGSIVGVIHSATTTSALATAALTTAYNDAAGRTLCDGGVGYGFSVAGDLGGRTLTPGLYKSLDSLEITSGDLTLDARGEASAVWIFQMATTLMTASGRQVILAGGARSADVFWQVGTAATLGSTTTFQGTVMADQAITLGTGVTVNGRVLARIAAVSLDSNVIVRP